jgi:hypothetical protein
MLHHTGSLSELSDAKKVAIPGAAQDTGGAGGRSAALSCGAARAAGIGIRDRKLTGLE